MGEVPFVVVFGAGASGSGAVARAKEMDTAGAALVCIDTDKVSLGMLGDSVAKALVGKRVLQGTGARGGLGVGKKAVSSSKRSVERLVENADIVFLLGGMGKGTASAAIPFLAEMARNKGSFVVSIVTYPLELEQRQSFVAEDSIASLAGSSDALVVVDLNRLVELVPGLSTKQVYSLANEVLAKSIKLFSETLSQPSLRQLGLDSVRQVLGRDGMSAMAFGEAPARGNFVDSAVRDTLDNVMFSSNPEAASGLLVLVSGDSVSLEDAKSIAEKMNERVSATSMAFGARIDSNVRGKVEVFAFFSGLGLPYKGGKMDSSAQRNSAGVSRYAVRGSDGALKKGIIEI